MKIYVNVLVALMMCCLLTISYRVPALASEIIPDTEKSDGSITVILRDPVTNKPINGITLTLYKVGEVRDGSGESIPDTDGTDSDDQDQEDIPDGIYIDIYGNPDNRKIPLEDVYSMLAEEWEEWAAELETYVLENDIQEINPPGSITVGADGTAAFEDLIPGLYLVAQTGDLRGYVMSAFLVMLPMMEGDSLYYNYNVVAIPKVIKSKIIEEPDNPRDPEVPDSPDNPHDPGDNDNPYDPGDSYDSVNSEELVTSEAWQRPVTPANDSILPQTGQLWWPVTAMSVTGLLCCGIGYRLKHSCDRSSHRER